MIRGRYLSIMDDLSDVIHMRKEIFNTDIDKNDDLAVNVIVFDKEIPVGTGRIILDSDGNFIIDKVGVLEEYRGKGYGEFIIRLLADKALLSGAKFIYLTATENTVPFFEKLFFKKEKNNDIVNMILNLSDMTTPCGHKCTK
jgi:GNAT superfamily N-acetyltransferase